LLLDTKQVTGFVLDWMHTFDGGILRRAVAYLFVVGKTIVAEHVQAKYPSHLVETANDWIKRWSKCIPSEFSRRQRPLDEIEKWKMRETEMTGTMILPALARIPDVSRVLDKGHFNSYLKLVTYSKLIGGFSTTPASPDDIDLAERLIVEYIDFIKRNGRVDTVPYVSHSAGHQPDECRFHKGLRLGHLSAYPFENFIKYFKPVSKIYAIKKNIS
jgi:hypothetical protein